MMNQQQQQPQFVMVKDEGTRELTIDKEKRQVIVHGKSEQIFNADHMKWIYEENLKSKISLDQKEQQILAQINKMKEDASKSTWTPELRILKSQLDSLALIMQKEEMPKKLELELAKTREERKQHEVIINEIASAVGELYPNKSLGEVGDVKQPQ